MGCRRKRLEQAKTVAVGCDQLPRECHGKEGSRVRLLVERLPRDERVISSPRHTSLVWMTREEVFKTGEVV
jgi:hypothetical protein